MRDRNNNIILTGFMGSGKTTAGIRLSYRLRLPLLDTDKWIEKEEGRTIFEIFALQGEETFSNWKENRSSPPEADFPCGKKTENC